MIFSYDDMKIYTWKGNKRKKDYFGNAENVVGNIF